MRIGKIGALMIVFALGLTIPSSTRGDIVMNFNHDFVNTLNNPGQSLEIPSGLLIGTLTEIQANFVMTAQTGGVWRSDLAVFITNQNSIQTSGNGGAGIFQVGGYDNAWGATAYQPWNLGDDDLLNVPLIDAITLTTPITFNGNSSDPNIFLANLYNAPSTSSFNGTITLVGLTAIPEPSSLAIIALVGMTVAVGRRRR